MRIPAAFRPPTAEIGSSSNVPVMGDPASAIRGAVAALLVLGSTMSPMAKPPPALALDAAAVGTCVVTQCTPELAGCITDGSCLANLLCIQTCNNKPDEADCQIACGDKFSSAKVDSFTKCAVTNKKCVPQRQDDGSWPVPKEEALVKSFNTADFTGPWYISAGLNKAFDTFDCQLHKFESPAPGKLVGNLQWRIKDPVAGTNFVTRYTIQEFVQDAKSPAILYNHDNDFLHYEDDWYVLAQKKGEYVLVYYRGNNDAWDGYGGAVVYSTSPVLNPKYYDEIDAALQTVGHRWSEMTITDNTCKERESKFEEAIQDAVFVETRVAGAITSNPIVQEIEKDIVAVEKEIEKDVVAVEKEIVKDVVAVEKEIVKDFTAVEKEIEKDVVGLEKEVEKDVGGIFGMFKK